MTSCRPAANAATIASKRLAALGLAAVLGTQVTLADHALAASTTAPGETTGLGLYTALPVGLYMTNIVSGGSRTTSPNTIFDFYNPFLYWQTPFSLGGFKISFFVADSVANVQAGSTHITGIYNPFFGTNWVYNINKDLGFGFGLAGYTPTHTNVGYNFGTIEERAGITYTGYNSDLTANFIHGNTMKDVSTGQYDIPDYLLVDLTATKHFGKVEAGFIAYGSTDLGRAYAGYNRQSQFAVGGLIGYSFPTCIVQLKASVDVYQRNYSGYDRRLWANVIFPLITGDSIPKVDHEMNRRY